MATLAASPKTYMKVSGLLSEVPFAADSFLNEATPAADLMRTLQPWLHVVLRAFGPARLMFGSDWPVCEVSGGRQAWSRWREVVECWLDVEGLGRREREMVWAGTARVAYGLAV